MQQGPKGRRSAESSEASAEGAGLGTGPKKGLITMTKQSSATSAISAEPSPGPAGARRTVKTADSAAAQAPAGSSAADPSSAKRTVANQSASQGGLSTQDLILVAVLLAAGAVLKLTVASFLSFAGMKPNFIIAMYCLAIILTKPKLGQAVAIGLLTGLICQIPMLNATPLVNIPL